MSPMSRSTSSGTHLIGRLQSKGGRSQTRPDDDDDDNEDEGDGEDNDIIWRIQSNDYDRFLRAWFCCVGAKKNRDG